MAEKLAVLVGCAPATFALAVLLYVQSMVYDAAQNLGAPLGAPLDRWHHGPRKRVRRHMKWQPADIIRLVALIGGFLLAGVGALMMWLGISAEGAIDIKGTVLSGSIRTGSAGLFIVFFAFGIIVYVLASLAAAHSQVSTIQRQSRTNHIGRAFWAVLAGLVFSGSMGAMGYGAGFGGLAIFLGFMLFFVGVAYVVNLEP